MRPQQFLYVIVGISVLTYLFNEILDYINLRAQRKDIPDEVAAFYQREKYLKSLDYHHDQTRLSFLSSAFSFLISMIMLLTGGFGWLDSVLRPYFTGEISLALAFFAVILVVSDIASLPFQWYATFVLEEKYQFNKTTPRTFLLDKMKGYALGGVVGGGLLALLIFLVESIGPNFWIWFGTAAAVFILFVNMFYTTLVLPLFNKLSPLPDGDLKAAIEQFARNVSFPLTNILIIDGSKRSKKANAFFSGIGKKKKIVLYDTLIANHTTEELVAVLAHEVGHYKKKHIIFGYILSVIQIFFTLFVLSLMISNVNLSLALGGSQQAIHLNLLAFGILYSPVAGITGLLMSMYSRRNEFQADAFAKESYSGTALAAALKKLSVDNLSNLYPHPWYVFFHYSHPPLLQRLAAINK